MFYLRRIEKDSTKEANSTLGKTYAFEQRDTCKEWKSRKEKVLDWMSENQKERVWGIVYDENGKPTPIFEDLTYYIMTENGNTYAKLI